MRYARKSLWWRCEGQEGAPPIFEKAIWNTACERGWNNIKFLHKGLRINQSDEELWRDVDRENEGKKGTSKYHS